MRQTRPPLLLDLEHLLRSLDGQTIDQVTHRELLHS